MAEIISSKFFMLRYVTSPSGGYRRAVRLAHLARLLGLLSVASLAVFRGTPKGALLEAYLNPGQFEYSKAVRGVLAR